MSGSETLPVALESKQTAPSIVVAPMYQDPITRALYVHQDLVRVQEPWAEEAHVSPMNVTERFGDVESFVDYVKRFGGDDISAPKPFLTWNARGLEATLDYATPGGVPGRCRWDAVHPFVTTRQWNAWMTLAGGRPVGQRQTIETLEDLGADILEPTPTELANLLRTLRAAVSAKADTELRPDGTTNVSFVQDKTVKSGTGDVALPPSFTIGIPVLKGHVDDEGRPVVYKLQVRLRVSVDDQARLAFRFSIPDAERVLEDVYADRVKLAKELLGPEFSLLRAAD